jgi:anti-sigma regulatory factor (Ser/Thr protein kinase)
VPVPISPSTVDAKAYRAPRHGLEETRQSPPTSNRSLTGSGAALTPPLVTPLALGETERRLKFRGLPQAVGAARRLLREWEGHFEPGLFYDLSLCVSELVTNRVQHGRLSGDDEAELVVRRGETLLRAEIRGHQPDVVMTKPLALVRRDLGMFIVDRVADRWGVDRREGTLVWCEVDLASDGRSRAVLS